MAEAQRAGRCPGWITGQWGGSPAGWSSDGLSSYTGVSIGISGLFCLIRKVNTRQYKEQPSDVFVWETSHKEIHPCTIYYRSIDAPRDLLFSLSQSQFLSHTTFKQFSNKSLYLYKNIQSCTSHVLISIYAIRHITIHINKYQ